MAESKILSANDHDLKRAADALARGAIVALPTETVYGLAAALSQEQAIANIFSAKQRPHFDPLIVHVPTGIDSCKALIAEKLVSPTMSAECRELADRLMQAFWPGPLTIVLPRGAKVPDLAASGLPTVAIRMPAHPVTQKVLTYLGAPLVAPSANRFGRISPVSADDVRHELRDVVPLIIDGGPCQIGIESTIVSLDNTARGVYILRHGGISQSALAAMAPVLNIPPSTRDTIVAPGQLASHYAPEHPVCLLPQAFSGEHLSMLLAFMRSAWQQRHRHHDEQPVFTLLTKRALPAALQQTLYETFGERGILLLHLTDHDDSHEAARCLFRCLRSYDRSHSTMLFVEPIADHHDLWPAIKDRLYRATQPKHQPVS